MTLTINKELFEELKNKKQLQQRIDGRIEWTCPKHKVGHTIYYPKGSDSRHGCCGCCKTINEE